MQHLPQADIQEKADEGDEASIRLLALQKKPLRYVNAIPLLAIATGLYTGAAILPPLAHIFREYLPGTVLSVLLALLLIFLIVSAGILSFRRVGTFFPEKTAFRYLKAVMAISSILYPAVYLATFASRLFARLFGVEIGKESDPVTEEEIISMVDEAHEKGIIEENEAEMIQNIITFNETSAGDIMTHRKNIIAIQEDLSLQQVVDFMLEEGNSRYPVYRDGLDNITGVIHYKDALKYYTRTPAARSRCLTDIPDLVRQAVCIPETRGIGALFHTMQKEKVHLAVVIDEYGQTAGIVTMEDILEEIVGDILDEYDDDAETLFRKQKDQSMVIDALAHLSDIEEGLGIRFKDSEFETLNGVLTSILGHIPTEKDVDKEIETNGYRFRILSIGNKTISKVRAEKLPAP